MPKAIKKHTEENCKLCNEPFSKTRHWKVFCSDKCRRTWYNGLNQWAEHRVSNSEEDMDDFLRHAGLR